MNAKQAMEAWTTMADFLPLILALRSRLQAADSFFPRHNDTLLNPSWDHASCRVAIVRLSSHSDVAESSTHAVLYGQLRRAMPEAYIDLAFMPPPRDQQVLNSKQVPWPLPVASLRCLADFDVILFSLSYVLESLNLPLALTQSVIPRLSSLRNSAQSPLVLAGGSSILLCQGIVPYCEGLFFGEIEAALQALATVCLTKAQNRRQGRTFNLSEGPDAPGLWYPGLGQVAVARLPAGSYPYQELAYPVLNGSEASTVRLGISLGCPFRCSFCYEGYERKPYRDLKAEALLSTMEHLRATTGAKSIDFVSFNFNTHQSIIPLLEQGAAIFPYVHLMSQRLDILYRQGQLLEAELLTGKRSFTLGVEGVSKRMRHWYQKDLPEAAIPGIIGKLLAARIRDIKLFYIISGHENNQDCQEFAAFVQQLRTMVQAYGTCRVLFSFGILMRMPHTPLGHDPYIWDTRPLHPLIAILQSSVEAAGFEGRLAFAENDYLAAQYLVSAPMADAHSQLERWYAKGLQFAKQLSPNASRELPPVEQRPQGGLDYQHPFAFVHGPVYQAMLAQRYTKLTLALEAPSASASNGATDADAPLEGGAHGIDAAASALPQSLRQLRQLQEYKRQLRPLTVQLPVPPELAGAGREWLQSWAYRYLRQAIAPQLPPGIPAAALFDILLASDLDPQWYHQPWWGQGRFTVQIISQYATQLCPLLARYVDQVSAPRSLTCNWHLQGAELEQVDNVCQQVLRANHIPFTLQKSPQAIAYLVSPKQKNKSAVTAAQLSSTKGQIIVTMDTKLRFPAWILSAELQKLQTTRLLAVEFANWRGLL
jgi:hypothetical protein